MRKYKNWILSGVATTLSLGSVALGQPANIIPKPDKMVVSEKSFTLKSTTVISAPAELKTKAQQLRDLLEPATGYSFKGVARSIEKNVISLQIDKGLKSLGDEGYRLNVTPDSVKISAATTAGIYYGIQSLRQLLPPQIEQVQPAANIEWLIPCVSVTDSPRFPWRGYMKEAVTTLRNS